MLTYPPAPEPPFWGREIEGLDLYGFVCNGPADFRGAHFKGYVSFAEAAFLGPALFQGATFENGVTFLGARFGLEADFSRCSFYHAATFWRTVFCGPARFDDIQVWPIAGKALGSLRPGEANLSWAHFQGETSFYRAQFHGPVWMWRTAFCAGVRFDEAYFESDFLLDGARYEVRLSERDFPDHGVFERLRRTDAVRPDPETSDGRYVFFGDVRTAEGVRKLLATRAVSAADQSVIADVWTRFARPSFSGHTSFAGVAFGKPEAVTFGRVDLSECWFKGTDLTKVQFHDVTWDKARMFLFRTWRKAVHDERGATDSESLALLSKLNYELRKNYDSRGAQYEAGDFYYGEMDARRRQLPGPYPIISLLAVYRYLSGYGQQPGLALLWLVLLVLVVSPALYLVTGGADNAVSAVVHSLEAATFLRADPQGTAPLAARFVEGVQRILVALQASLFALSLKRRFERK